MKNGMARYQEKVLKILANKIDDFYLAGGTALSNFYFWHRDSEDLDFFTGKYEKSRVMRIAEDLAKELQKPISMLKQQTRKNLVKMMVFSITFTKKDKLKIDFVEDCIKLIKQTRNINGINVMALEDIYLRKIYAVAGYFQTEDIIGQKRSLGGRQEAEDFYDLYYLSHTFMNLADFAGKYCDDVIRENLIRWYRTYSRMDMKIGLQDLKIKKRVDCRDIEKYLKYAALLLSRENSPKEVFTEYLEPLSFCRSWTLIKKVMRKDNWNNPRIEFWQAIYGKLIEKYRRKNIY